MSLPAPRDGLLGQWDRFAGPGMTRPELAMVLGASLFGGALALAPLAPFGPWLMLLGALIAFDVVGGAVCNLTRTTKRWYHRPGQTLKDHGAFIGLHVLHILAVAAFFRGPGMDWQFAASLTTLLGVAIFLIHSAPRSLRLPTAGALLMTGIALDLYVLGLTPGLEWFVPFFLLKLLVGHMVPWEENA